MPEWISPDGLCIHFADEGPKDAPAIILQHGFITNGENNWALTGISGALLKAGWRVIRPDARGHGRSDKPHDESFYGELRMAEDVIGIADCLGLTEFRLGGYSMGAVIALLVASQDKRVTRLAIGGVGESIVDIGGVDRRAVPAEKIAEALLAKKAEEAPPEAAGFRALVDFTGGDRLALAAQARSIHRGPIHLDRISVPALVFAGRDDPLAVNPDRLADALPDGTLSVFAGDHLSVFGDPALVPALAGFFGSAADA